LPTQLFHRSTKASNALQQAGQARCSRPSYGPGKDGQLVLQADHLITRANSATYADTRLIVCVCEGHHGWKKWHKPEYDALVKSVIGADRATLWERCEEDSWRPHRKYAADWRLHIAALEQELCHLRTVAA
jgi:hypothetical protein